MSKIVQQNKHGDIQWLINGAVFTELINGRKSMYSETERGLVGYTVILSNNMGKTWVHLQNYDEALETCKNNVANYKKIQEDRRRVSEYLTSDEGRWGI